MRPTSESYSLAVPADFHSFALCAPPDDRERARIGDRRQELVVLAELEVPQLGSVREGHALELDHTAHAGAPRDVARVYGDPVRDVEERVRVSRQLLALGQP